MIPTKINCPKCGSQMVKNEGLDGLFCSNQKCQHYLAEEPGIDDYITDAKTIFSEERVKHLRGVPVDTITIGSETKGRVQIQIPCGCTKAERRVLIDAMLDDLEYLKTQIESRGMDIYTSRGKKE